MKTRLLPLALCALGLLALTACNYDFPLTGKPTRKIDPRLPGDWVSCDQDEQKLEAMSIRQLDDFTYVVATDGGLYRVTHSDFAGTAFVSVQDLQPGSSYGKYAYYTWTLSADGRQLTLRGVHTRVVPEETKDQAAAQQLIRDNLANPRLLGDPIVFTPKKP